jgi:hypothetical protein
VALLGIELGQIHSLGNIAVDDQRDIPGPKRPCAKRQQPANTDCQGRNKTTVESSWNFHAGDRTGKNRGTKPTMIAGQRTIGAFVSGLMDSRAQFPAE